MRLLPLLLSGALLVGATLLPATAADAATTAKVTGTITDAHGVGVETTVSWFSPLSGKHGRSTYSDAETGAYSLTVPSSATQYVIEANVDEYGQREIDRYASMYADAVGTVAPYWPGLTRFATATAATIDIEVERIGKLSLEIPRLKGRSVSLQTLGGDWVDSRAVSTTGRVSFTHLVAGQYRIGYENRNSTYDGYLSEPLTVLAGEGTDATLTPAPRATISGVVTSGGKPVKGLTVYVYAADDDDYFWVESTTSATGAYSVRGVPQGRYSVSVVNPDSATTGYVEVRGRSLGVVHTDEKRTLNFSVARAGGVRISIAGYHGGAFPRLAVVGAHGTFTPASVSGSDTKWTLSGVPAGSYTVYVQSAQGRYGTRSVHVSGGTLTTAAAVTQTKHTVTLRARIAGATSGTVSVDDKIAFWSNFGRISHGVATIDGIVPGSVTVEVETPGHQMGTSHTTVTTSTTKTFAQGAKDVATGKITGRLLYPGRSIDELELDFEGASDSAYPSLSSNGSFSTTASPGEYTPTLQFWGEDFPELSPFFYATETPSVTVTSGHTTALGSVHVVVAGRASTP